MKIIQLLSENVKRIKAVHIKPDGSVVHIRGRNAQGKSSTLDSIMYALGGEGAQPPRVIRDGEERAQVQLDLGDFVVVRQWTSNNRSHLEVRSQDGAKYSSPQTMLNGLVGKLSFDPLAFTRLDAKKQAEQLRKLVGLDLSPLDARRKAIFDQRTDVNREVAQLRARWEAAPRVDAPDEPVSVDDLLAEQELLRDLQRDNDKMRMEAERARHAVSSGEALLQKAEQDVERLRSQLAEAEKHRDGMAAHLEELRTRDAELLASVANLSDPDMASVAQRIREVEATNTQVRKKQERTRLQEEMVKRAKDADALTAQLGALDTEKARLLAGAKFPVEGLSFSTDGVTFNGLPLEQASGAEQLRVSLAMGLALNPKLKVILIRDGSLLDEDSMKIVAEMAEAADAQVWVESVSNEKAGVGVLIEDGEAFGPEAQPIEEAATLQ